MRNTWKKTAAFLLAFTLAAVPLSQTGVKGGLFGRSGIVAYAAEESESFSTNTSASTYTGDHFKIEVTDKGDGDGFTLNGEGYSPATITALYGETINKIELVRGYYAGEPHVLSDTAVMSQDDETFTFTNINATSVVLDRCTGDDFYCQIKQVKVYFSEAAKKEISDTTIVLGSDYTTLSVRYGDTIVDPSEYDITYGTDTDHSSTTVPTVPGTYYAYVTAKDTSPHFNPGTAKSDSFEVAAAPTMTSASVTLNDGFGLNFYVDNITDAAGYTVMFDGVCDENGTEAALTEKDGKFFATANINAKDIKENIAATLYKDGVATDVTLTSSVDAYLTAALATDGLDDKTKALIEATQLYGCTADNYFNNAENDFNQMFVDFLTYAGLESDQTPLYAAINNAVANDNVNDEKVSLVLNSKVKLRIYSDNGTNENNYGKYSEITGLTPLTMGQNQTVGGCSVSGYTWVDRVLEKNEIDKNYYMAMALASYMYAAEKYAIVDVASVTITNAPTEAITVGDTGTLTATVSPDDATNKTVTWAVTEGTDVLSIDAATGAYTALKAGTAKVTASAGGKTAECTITVKAPATLAGVTLTDGMIIEPHCNVGGEDNWVQFKYVAADDKFVPNFNSYGDQYSKSGGELMQQLADQWAMAVLEMNEEPNGNFYLNQTDNTVHLRADDGINMLVIDLQLDFDNMTYTQLYKQWYNTVSGSFTSIKIGDTTITASQMTAN